MNLDDLNKKSSEEQTNDVLHTNELLNVEGGDDSDMDDCNIGLQCITGAEKTCYTGA